jgi:hypothetical protein
MKRNAQLIAILLTILTLVLPFMIMIQADIVVIIRYYGPFWLLDTSSVSSPELYIYWFNLPGYLPFYGIPFGNVKLAYDALKNESTSRFDYLSKTIILLFVHIVVLFIFAFNIYGDPEPFEIPLPIVGIVSLFLTFLIEQPKVPWQDEEQANESFSKEKPALQAE